MSTMNKFILAYYSNSGFDFFFCDFFSLNYA